MPQKWKILPFMSGPKSALYEVTSKFIHKHVVWKLLSRNVFFFPHNESLEVTVYSSSAVSHGLNIYIFLQRVFDLSPQALLVCGAPGEQSTKVCCASLTGTCGMRWGDGGGWMSLTHDSVFMGARAAVHRPLWAPVQMSSQVCCFILKLCPEAVGGSMCRHTSPGWHCWHKVVY